MLAKALFDNLADAPDELTFRKGDIVTVIERDVDGLIGWWLCLLHGRQGIVPGNRLQVIPSVELDEFEKDTRKRGSYDTDEFSDAADVVEGASHNYDTLPSPIKSGYPAPLSIKDMFNIPYKKDDEIDEVYDVPKAQNQEIYDTPKGQDVGPINQEHATLKFNSDYKVPKPTVPGQVPNGNKSDEVYDVPNQKSAYKVPQTTAAVTKVKISNDAADGNTDEVYDVPKSHNEFDVDALMGEIYDSPFSNDTQISTIKRSPISSSNTTPRNSITISRNSAEAFPKALGDEVYDVPRRSSIDAASDNNRRISSEVYDTPSQINSPKYMNNAENMHGDFYDTPKSQISSPKYLNTSENVHQEFYDTPKFENSSGDTYKTVLQEVYDIPSSKSLQRNTTLQTPQYTPKSQTVPRTLTPQGINSTGKSTRLQDIYDIPSTTLNRNSYGSSPLGTPVLARKQILVQEIYDVPPSTSSQEINNETLTMKQEIYDTPTSKQEIYDTPTSKQELYDTPTSKQANVNRPISDTYDTIPDSSYKVTHEEVYDIPPSNTLRRNQFSNMRETDIEPPGTVPEDIYDVPANHNLNQVMSDVTAAYSSHKGSKDNQLSVSVEDDYVDYQDIWTKEPPKHLVQEHAQVMIIIICYFVLYLCNYLFCHI